MLMLRNTDYLTNPDAGRVLNILLHTISILCLTYIDVLLVLLLVKTSRFSSQTSSVPGDPSL